MDSYIKLYIQVATNLQLEVTEKQSYMPFERGRTTASERDEILFGLLSACYNRITRCHQWYIPVP